MALLREQPGWSKMEGVYLIVQSTLARTRPKVHRNLQCIPVVLEQRI